MQFSDENFHVFPKTSARPAQFYWKFGFFMRATKNFSWLFEISGSEASPTTIFIIYGEGPQLHKNWVPKGPKTPHFRRRRRRKY